MSSITAPPPVRRTRRDTRRLVVEAIVIIGSILAAFALDRWYDRRRAHAEEQQMLQGLQTEFEQAKASLQRYRDLQRRILSSLESTIASVRAAEAAGTAVAIIPDTALSFLYVAPTVRPSLGTLDGLIASARMGVISDVQLRNALATWSSLFEELAEEEAESRVYVVQNVDPVLRARVNVAPFRILNLHLFDGTLTPDQLRGASRIPADREVMGVLMGRLFFLTHGIDEYEPVIRHVERILQLIDSARALTR